MRAIHQTGIHQTGNNQTVIQKPVIQKPDIHKSSTQPRDSRRPLPPGHHSPQPKGGPRKPGRASGGFALPLALVGALGLLLGSLALQSVGLAARQRTVVEQRLQRAEDRLASGAHRLVGAISHNHGCLLALPLERWPLEGALCTTPEQRAALLEAADGAGELRLISWQPRTTSSAAAAEVEILLEARAAANGGPAAEPTRRQAFVFALAEAPRRARDLRSLGLRGVQP